MIFVYVLVMSASVRVLAGCPWGLLGMAFLASSDQVGALGLPGSPRFAPVRFFVAPQVPAGASGVTFWSIWGCSLMGLYEPRNTLKICK